MNEPIKNEAMTLSPLAVKVNERLRVLCINKQMLAVQYHCSRSMISQYLSGKYRSNPETVEEILNRFLDETEEEYQKTLENDPKAKKVLEKMRAQDGSDEEEPEEAPEKHFPKKSGYWYPPTTAASSLSASPARTTWDWVSSSAAADTARPTL